MSTGIPVRSLKDHPIALQKLSQCLDREYRRIYYWLHFAYILEVESCVIDKCKVRNRVSPTINLFEYLGATNQELSVKDLKDAMYKIKRVDIYEIIDKNFKDKDKVSEVITKSNPGEIDVLDEIALELDRESNPVANWKNLSNALHVPRTVYHKFEMKSYLNPTVALVKYLYVSSEKPIYFKDFMDGFIKMERNDIITEVQKSVDFNESSDVEACQILKLDSDLLQNVADLLNKDITGVKGWRELGRHFKVDHSTIDSLEPSQETEAHSPTTNIINWLTAARPATTVSDLMKPLEKIKRFDALKILKSYFETEVSYDENINEVIGIVPEIDDVNERNTTTNIQEKPMLGIQATEQTCSRIFQGDVRNFGLPSKSWCPIIGREKEKEELKNHLTKDGNKMVVLHATPGCGKTTLVINVAHDIIQDPYGYTVVYVDSKEVFSIEDLAYKILTTCGISSFQMCPTSQVIQLFTNSNQDCVLVIENLDHMYHSIDTMNKSSTNETGLLTEEFPWETSTPTSKKDEFRTFLKSVIKSAKKLKVLVTTWEPFHSLFFDVKSMTLKLLDECQSLELLRSRSEVSITNEEMLETILKRCGGIPLLLCASGLFLRERDGAEAACMQFAASSPENQFNILCPDSLPEEQRLNLCLKRYFERMKMCSREVLVLLSVFPNAFTLGEAQHISKGSEIDDLQLEEGFKSLKRIAFLNIYNVEFGKYSLHPAVRSFGILEAKKDNLKSVFETARWRFIFYTFHILAEIEDEFFSKSSKSAIQHYKLQDENVREIARWCITESNMDIKIKQFCIESFMHSQYVLLKLMRSHQLKLILCKFAQLCQKERTLNNLYSECLILGGAKIVTGCLCTPYICPTALKEASWCFCKVKERSRGEEERFDDICNISDQAKAQFLLQYGKCLVRHGYTEQGFESIRNGIKVRKMCFDSLHNRKNLSMLARSYEDLAGAHSYTREHAKAILLREKHVLPIFSKELGIHPFTATSQSQLARNYFELGDYDKALQANDIALKYRRALLGDHQDTARSLFDNGAILSEKAQGAGERSSKFYEEALSYLEEALKMQESVMDTPQEKAKTHQELAVVLTQLGRKEEAEQQMNKITVCMKRMKQNHDNLPQFPNN